MLVGSLHKFGAIFCVAMIAGLVVSSSALAVEWQEAGKKIVKAKNVISKSVGNTHVEGGKILFSDNHLNVSIACNVSDTGTIGPGAVGTIDTFSTINCEIVKDGGGDCDSAPSVATLDLPWKMELYEEGGGEVRNSIEKEAGGAEPKFELICHDEEGEFFDDTCGAETTTGIANEPPGVLASFEGLSAKTKCEGVAGAGQIQGNDFISGCPNMNVG
jgi:hypothetical protein